MESLTGKVAMVTGGSRGIGLAIASALVADGARVVITGKSEAHLSDARPVIEKAGPGAIETLRADVRRYDEVEHAVDANHVTRSAASISWSTTPASGSSPT
jgi:NAD(P)-dependent dehydrogenase (short-subunit alcohol dehydrogenase family)